VWEVGAAGPGQLPSLLVVGQNAACDQVNASHCTL
jgi:hypothetical protein